MSGQEARSAATTAFVPPEGCGCPSPTYDCPSEPCCTDSSCCCHISSQNREHGAPTPDGVERGLERSSVHAPDVSAAYAPEGYSACPFCGEEVDDRRSEIMAEAHLTVEKLISVEPGSDEFWQLRAEVAAFVGGEVDA